MTMTASDAARVPREPVESPITVLGVVSALLRRKRLLGLTAAVGLVPLLLVVGTMRPLYVSEATLELSFNREEVAASTTVSRQMASMDPGALVNGAAHRMVSRANAGRVVRRLGLDRAEAHQGSSVLSAIVGAVRGV